MNVGNVMHCRKRLVMFWSCPIVNYFWKEIITRVNMVLNTTLIPWSNMGVVWHIPKEFKLNPFQIVLLQEALIIACRIIWLCWRSRTFSKGEIW